MNGYTQIEYDGKTIGIKFGLPARQWLTTILTEHPDFSENAGPGINATYGAAIIYTGYKNNCAITLAKPELDFAFFLSFIEATIDDDGLKKQLDDALQVWTESVEIKKIIKAVEEKGIKKKNGVVKKLKVTAMVH